MKYFLTSLIFLFVVLTPVDAQAQLLTCTEGDQCNFCELTRTLDNIIDWVVMVAILIAVIGLAYAGFRMSSSRGDVSTFTTAKDMLWNIVIGLFIIMAAWMIVDTIIKTLAGGDLGVWNELDNCGVMFKEGDVQQKSNLDASKIDVVAPKESAYTEEGRNSIVRLDGTEVTQGIEGGVGVLTFGGSYTLDSGINNLNGLQCASFLQSVRSCEGYDHHEGNHLHVSIGKTSDVRIWL